MKDINIETILLVALMALMLAIGIVALGSSMFGVMPLVVNALATLGLTFGIAGIIFSIFIISAIN